MHPSKGGRTPPSPGRLRPPPSYRATTPTSSMGLFETHWNRLPRQSARWALFGRRRSGSSGNGTGSSRRSSRGQPTQESILGPIPITIYISMNNGDSDAMDNVHAAMISLILRHMACAWHSRKHGSPEISYAVRCSAQRHSHRHTIVLPWESSKRERTARVSPPRTSE